MIGIDAALEDPNLLGAALGNPKSWANWLAVLRAAFGLPLNATDRAIFKQVAGERKPPKGRVSELWAICGRRSGKTRMAAAIAAYVAAFLEHGDKLAPGEQGFILCLSPTLAQSQLLCGYVAAFLQSSPILARRIQSVTTTEVRLTGNITISTHPNSFRSVRGRALICAVFDESSFWRDENSAVPDVETYRAVLPSLATTDGMLVGISSPYRKTGLLYAKHRDHYGKDDPDVLIVHGSSQLFNPTLSAKLIAKSYEADPVAAASEWGGIFRSDLSAFLADEQIDAAVDLVRPAELAPQQGTTYACFVDASAGRHDQFTICIGHQEDSLAGSHFVADVVRGHRPPFDPETVAAEYASLAKQYRVTNIAGDNFAGEWCAGAFRKHGLDYVRFRLNKSQLYLESLPSWMRGAVSIPNMESLLRELRLLERSTRAGGRDIVDHPKGPGFTDDLANALCGCVHLVMGELFEEVISLCGPVLFDRSSGAIVAGELPSFMKEDKPLKADLNAEFPDRRLV